MIGRTGSEVYRVSVNPDPRRVNFEAIEETEMKGSKSVARKSFLLGVTFGIGVAVLSLYTGKPGWLADSLGAVAKMGRARKAKRQERKLQRKKLRAIGFSDKEIDEIL